MSDNLGNVKSYTPVPNSGTNQPAALEVAQSPIASQIVPRLRMLKLIQQALPHKVRICPGYTVTYWTETLSCGHQHTQYIKDGAKRRNCNVCVNLAKEERTA